MGIIPNIQQKAPKAKGLRGSFRRSERPDVRFTIAWPAQCRAQRQSLSLIRTLPSAPDSHRIHPTLLLGATGGLAGLAGSSCDSKPTTPPVGIWRIYASPCPESLSIDADPGPESGTGL